MDEWESMGSPRTAASYYMQRSGVFDSGSGTQDLSLPVSALAVNASAELSQGELNASAELSKGELDATTILSQGELNASAELSKGELDASTILSQEEPVKRKPGRPRKRGPDGTVFLGLPKSVQSKLGGNSGSAFQQDSSSPISADGVNASQISAHVASASAGLSQEELNASARLAKEEPDASTGPEEPVRRKRGRPRKRELPKSVQSKLGGSSAGSVIQPDSSSPISAHGVNATAIESVRRRRGRLRKRGTNGTVSLGSPKQNMPFQSNLVGNASGSVFQLDSLPLISADGVDASAGQSQGETVRRRPGRPRKKGLFSVSSAPPLSHGSAGTGLTPHVITVAVGEDVAEKVMSFLEQEPRAVCILSANGTVSTVTLVRPSTSSGTIKYEGSFEILWLSGSYVTDNDGPHSRTGGLSVCLCGQNDEVIYGGVGEMLVAATQVQVIVGSFSYSGSNTKHNEVTISESCVNSGDKSVPSTRTPPSSKNLQG